MRKRTWIVAAAVVVLVVATSAALYLTGTAIVGHPFSGVWNTDPASTLGPHGTWVTTGPNLSSGALIKRTSAGYVCTMVAGTHITGWFPLRRQGWTLTGNDHSGASESFTYQPWNGHLISTVRKQGHVEIGPMVLKKVTSSTSIPPRTD